MTQRAKFEALSARTGIKFETLRSRWQRGLRGDDLVRKKLPARRAPPEAVPTEVTKLPPLPVLCPESRRYR